MSKGLRSQEHDEFDCLLANLQKWRNAFALLESQKVSSCDGS